MKLPAFFAIVSSVKAEPSFGATISCNGNKIHGIPSATCNKWVHCNRGTGIVQVCAPGTFWNKNQNGCRAACANPQNCCLFPEPETTTTTTADPPTTTTTTATTTTTEDLSTDSATTEVEPNAGNTIYCNGNQMHGVPSATCNKWVQCVGGYGIVQICAPGTFWNKNQNACREACANPDNCCLYPGTESPTTTTTTTTATTTTTTTEDLTSAAQTTAAPSTVAPTTDDTTTTTVVITTDGTSDDSTTESADDTSDTETTTDIDGTTIPTTFADETTQQGSTTVTTTTTTTTTTTLTTTTSGSHTTIPTTVLVIDTTTKEVTTPFTTLEPATEEPSTADADTTTRPRSTTTPPTTVGPPVTTTEAPVLVDCLVDNGGCSHYCNAMSQQCECPTCWVLGDDGVTCGIDQSKIELTCSDTGFDIQVDECIFIGDTDDTVVLGLMNHGNSTDGACQTFDYDNGVHSISGGLDNCGTEASYDDDGTLSFSNILEVVERAVSNGIMFNSEATIPGMDSSDLLNIVSCEYFPKIESELPNLPAIIKRRLRKTCPITGKIHYRTDYPSDMYRLKFHEK